MTYPRQETQDEELLTRLITKLGRSLGAFRSTTQALLNGGDSDEAFRREMLQAMDGELGELQRLLDNVVQYKALKKGTFRLQRAMILPSIALWKLAARWQAADGPKRIHWRVEIPDDLPPALVDLGKLEQTLENVLAYVVHFSPAGSTVAISARADAEGLQIGIGTPAPAMRQDEYDRLFDLFYTASNLGRFPVTTGLELHVAKMLADAQGGRLQVSAPAVTTDLMLFTLLLPQDDREHITKMSQQETKM